jgi:hypothetical protein
MPFLGIELDIDPVFSRVLYPNSLLEKLRSVIIAHDSFKGITIDIGGYTSLHREAFFGFDECLYENWERVRLLSEGEERICEEFPGLLLEEAKVKDWSAYRLNIFHPIMEWNPIEGNDRYLVCYALKYAYHKINRKKVKAITDNISSVNNFHRRSIVVCK